MPLIRLAWFKPNQANSAGAPFYLENNKRYKSCIGSRVCGPQTYGLITNAINHFINSANIGPRKNTVIKRYVCLVTFGYKSNIRKYSFSFCLLARIIHKFFGRFSKLLITSRVLKFHRFPFVEKRNNVRVELNLSKRGSLG